MPLEKIQHMLAVAPRVSQWWGENKEDFESSEKMWKKRKKVCWGFALPLIGMFGVFTIASVCTQEIVQGVFLCGAYLGLFGFLSLGFFDKRIESRQRLFNTQRYKQGIDQLYFDPDFASKEFSHNQRAELIGKLNSLGGDGQQIVALRNLDLPNSWWHTINAEVEKCAQMNPLQKPTLDEVYIQVQSSIVSENHSKVLRL